MKYNRKQRHEKQRAEAHKLIEAMKEQLAQHAINYETLPDEPPIRRIDTPKKAYETRQPSYQ